jgi:deoxyribodipyrimidine photo-lyase
VPALVIDRAFEERLRRSPRRAAFYCGAVASLQRALEARGAALTIRSGTRIATVRRLAREVRADTVIWSRRYDAAAVASDRALQSAIEETGVRALAVHDAPAVPPEETAAARTGGGAGYRAFAPYVDAWQSARAPVVATRPAFASAALESEPVPGPARFGSDASAPADAAESGAGAALEAFLAGPILGYATAANVPSLATSGLAAHLSFGTIAARTILERVEQRAADPFLLAEERRSIVAFCHALARRDFFFQLAWFYERAADEALQARMRRFPFARTHAALGAWERGETGYPIVDAAMRELRATGTMHPRARHVAASFLCFDLGVDWRVGRDVWDRLLVEDEPALATGNWQWVAGVGADLAQFPRIFNPRKQARRLDPEGDYVRRWVPELAGLPGAEILEPDLAARRSQLALPLFAGAGYPAPVIDHESAARAFLARYAAFASSGQR